MPAKKTTAKAAAPADDAKTDDAPAEEPKTDDAPAEEPKTPLETGSRLYRGQRYVGKVSDPADGMVGIDPERARAKNANKASAE